MKQTLIALVALIALFTTIPAVIAQQDNNGLASIKTTAPIAERPQYVAGDKWVFDRNGKPYEKLFVEYEGTAFVTKRTYKEKAWFAYSSLDGNPIKAMDEKGNVLWEHRGEYAMFRFPLQVGKKWDELYYSRGSVARRMQVWVTAYEQVTVPAGTFWAFRIEAVNQRLDRPLPAYETYWYAPATKSLIKYVSNEFQLEMKLLQYVPTLE